MSGIINQVGAKSGIISGSGTASAGTVTLSGTTGLDYEEGLFTPSYTPSGDAFTTDTYDQREGHYTKIGRLVNVTFKLGTDAIAGGTGAVYVSGFPFTFPVAMVGVGATAWSWSDLTNGEQNLETLAGGTTCRIGLDSVGAERGVSDMRTSANSNRFHCSFSFYIT